MKADVATTTLLSTALVISASAILCYFHWRTPAPSSSETKAAKPGRGDDEGDKIVPGGREKEMEATKTLATTIQESKYVTVTSLATDKTIFGSTNTTKNQETTQNSLPIDQTPINPTALPTTTAGSVDSKKQQNEEGKYDNTLKDTIDITTLSAKIFQTLPSNWMIRTMTCFDFDVGSLENL